MMFAQELSERDTETRRTCCLEIQQHVPHVAVVLFSDEAHFHLCGSVNKQNFRYWAENNPRELHECPLHCPRVTVWCAVAEFCIWGPYFFEEDNVTVTVNSNRYCDMLETFLRPKLNKYAPRYGQCLVSTGLGNSPHFSTYDGNFEGDVSRSFDLIAW